MFLTTKYIPIYEIAQLRSHNTSDTTTAHFLKTKLFILLGPIINIVKNDDEAEVTADDDDENDDDGQ